MSGRARPTHAACDDRNAHCGNLDAFADDVVIERLRLAKTGAAANCAIMRLIDRLAARKAAFYFVERRAVAYNGSLELEAIIARLLVPGRTADVPPELLPVWKGSYLPFQDAFARWGFPDVGVVLIGCRDAAQRRALVAHVRRQPPLGLFDIDADADGLDQPLVLTGFLLPNAALRFSDFGRKIDRNTGLDVIGFHGEEESHVLQMLAELDFDDDEDPLGPGLLRALVRGAGRRLTAARASDGYASLVEQAYELFGLGAVSAAGAVAGVAFEQLMRAALDEAGRVWLTEQERHAKLNDVIGKVVSARRCDPGRLHRYRVLRNDFAHRLGDEQAAIRDDGELADEVERFLGWLDRQEVGDDGVARLVDVEPGPELSFEDLLHEAQAAGESAGREARTTPIKVAGTVFEPIGSAWVVVRDERRPFTRWLLEHEEAGAATGGAEIYGPFEAFERNLEWAYAFATRLREAGVRADYTGVAH